MAIYEYQGQNYDIATDDPVVAKQKIMTHLGITTPEPQPAESKLTQFGHGMASLADTGLNAITGGLDYGAYNLARAAGLSPEEATQQTTSPKDVIGRAMNITSSPSYQNEMSRQITGGIGQGVNAISQGISQNTGLPQQDVSSMLGSASMLAGPVGSKVTNTIGNAGRTIGQISEGAGGVLSGRIPTPGTEAKTWQTPSARQPVTDTYIPPDVLQAWRSGKISTEELKNQMIPYTEQQIKALSQTQGHVPFQGKEYQAAGEQLGEQIKSPSTYFGPAVATGLGALVGGPVGAGIGGVLGTGIKAYKAIQAAKNVSANKSLSNLGFSPLTVEEQAAFAKNTAHPTAPVSPAQMAQQAAVNRLQVIPQLPMSQPSTIPMGGPPRSVNIEGQTFNLPHQIDTSNSQGARGMQQPTVNAPVTPVVPETTTGITPETQQRWNETPGYKAPTEKQKSLGELLNEQRNKPAEPEPIKEKTLTQLEKQQKKEYEYALKQINEDMIQKHMQGEINLNTEPIDTGSNAYNNANSTKGQATQLVKAGFDSIPTIPGMTEAQVINAMFNNLLKNRNKITPPKGPSNVSHMIIGETPKKGPSNVSHMIIEDPQRPHNSFDLIKKPDLVDEYGSGELTREWKEGDAHLSEYHSPEYNNHTIIAASPRGDYKISTMLDQNSKKVELSLDQGDHRLVVEKSHVEPNQYGTSSTNRIYKQDKKTNRIYDNHVFLDGELFHLGEGDTPALGGKPSYKKFFTDEEINKLIDYIKNGEPKD
jgi:hypothetical protein